MEEQLCLNCSFWIPRGDNDRIGYCKEILYHDKNWLKGAEKRYSDSCTNFEPKSESKNESDNDFPFI